MRALGVGLGRRGVRLARDSIATPELEHAVSRPSSSRCPRRCPDGYVSEVCLAFQPWMASLAAQLEHGVALLIDYGLPRAQLYHPERVHRHPALPFPSSRA